jgi:hypothetical protein
MMDAFPLVGGKLAALFSLVGDMPAASPSEGDMSAAFLPIGDMPAALFSPISDMPAAFPLKMTCRLHFPY